MEKWEADGPVDELAPEGLDWRDWVRRYPIPALAIAAVGGYLLGRDRGAEILESAGSRAAETISDNVDQLIASRQ